MCIPWLRESISDFSVVVFVVALFGSENKLCRDSEIVVCISAACCVGLLLDARVRNESQEEKKNEKQKPTENQAENV